MRLTVAPLLGDIFVYYMLVIIGFVIISGRSNTYEKMSFSL